MLKIKQISVRPECVEGRMANYDTASRLRGGGEGLLFVTVRGWPMGMDHQFHVDWFGKII